MSERFPLTPDEFLQELEIDEIDPSFGRERGRTRRNVQLYNAQKARRERRVRNSAGFAHPANTVPLPATGITPPIAAGQEALPAYLTWYCEFANANVVQYPATGAITNAMVNTGVYCVGIAAATGLLRIIDLASVAILTVDLNQFVTHHGWHQMGVLFDPVGGRMALFADGDQLGAVSFAHATWSAGTWNYMWNTGTAAKVISIGTVSPLEVFPGHIPAGFTL